MKKVLSFTLVSLALAALSAPAFAKFEVSVRGDVGASGTQVPMLWTDTYTSGFVTQSIDGIRTNRDESIWDFTVRAAWYMGCSPCNPYVAASWQYSDHTKTTTSATLVQGTGFTPYFYVPNAAISTSFSTSDNGYAAAPGAGNSLTAEIGVLNRLSKFKFGFGVDLCKCCHTFALTGEFGLSAMNARLETSGLYTIGMPASGGTTPVPGFGFGSGSGFTGTLPFNSLVNSDEIQKTEGLGLYAMFKGEYKFPAICGASCFSVYGKVETTDYYARQTYSYDLNWIVNSTTAVDHDYNESTSREYNNVVEVDLEAALVYSPCFSTCWKDLNMSIALGVRTDSYVNLFVHTDNAIRGDSLVSLARPTFFGELSVKF